MNTTADNIILQELALLWYHHFPSRQLPPSCFFSAWKRADIADVQYSFQVGEGWLDRQEFRSDISTLTLAKYVSGVLRNVRKDAEILRRIEEQHQGKVSHVEQA